MTPRTGRPIQGEAKKDRRLEIRLTAAQYEELQSIADKLNMSKTNVIFEGIKLLKARSE